LNGSELFVQKEVALDANRPSCPGALGSREVDSKRNCSDDERKFSRTGLGLGLYVIDPMLCDVPVEPPVWLERFPPQRLNPAASPSPGFIQSLLRASEAKFRLFLAAARARPEGYKHLLADVGIATRLAQLGEPVRHWIERTGPTGETIDEHLQRLPAAVNQAGPMVRGEVIRIAFGIDLFTDQPWDLAGPGLFGVADARDYLRKMRCGKP
jgi:hypothetical protein